MDDSVAMTIDKDRKGRMIALGAGVCPIILKKTKHLLKQNEDLRNKNLELTDECYLPEALTSNVNSCFPYDSCMSALASLYLKICISFIVLTSMCLRKNCRDHNVVRMSKVENIVSISAEVSGDLTIEIEGVKYLLHKEIARDVNLPLAKLIALAEAMPDFARIEHDDLYKAIDIYLKEHVIITISANCGVSYGGGDGYSIGAITVMKILGYGWAGMLRRYLVDLSEMWWPTNLAQLLGTMIAGTINLSVARWMLGNVENICDIES
ncbi:hypothetical protein GIB67_034903 [Kingdonia uniflora]|uniref:NPH3 domain-containing protein n=1 Tax=Kingdonia uniflora TaxID=39325 RepID=A0A7J7NHB0_9MAGN|nr:hypothetical protein GIB67_034903 [Kingdonia uniflora]